MHTSGFLMISAWILNSAQLWFDLCADCEEETCKNLNIEASDVCQCSFRLSDALTPSETSCCFTEASSQSHWKRLLLRFRGRRQLIGRCVDQWGSSFVSWHHQKLINLYVFWDTFIKFIKSCWSDFLAEFKGTRSYKIIKSVIHSRSSQTFPPWCILGFITQRHTHTFVHPQDTETCVWTFMCSPHVGRCSAATTENKSESDTKISHLLHF